MRTRFGKVAVGAFAALCLTFALPASPAMAINEAACGNRLDLLKLEGSAGGPLDAYGSVCFANGGSVAKSIYGVSRISSGNNTVKVAYQQDSTYHELNLPKWGVHNFAQRVKVHQVWIL
jgi:hypothetical protein